MTITYYGHSCFLLETSGKRLLFDPYIRPNELAKHIDVAAIKPDYVLISHGHFDHIEDAISILQESGATAVCAWEIMVWLNKQGIEKVHPMNVGGKWVFDFGTVKCTAAQHSSGMPDGTYGGNPMGFIVQNSEGTFYYSGDTALTMDMKLIGEQFNLDIALLPLGDNFTMGIDDAVIAADFIKCNNILGVHYDTFGFIKIDHDAAKATFAKAGKKLTLLGIGEVLTV
ncbi:MAG: metal-dependent hydrolase [Candidatus Kapaibacteriota bacterium]